MGYYIHDDPTFYGVTDIKDAPFMHLGIEGKRWMMVNMLTGYGGTWTESGGVGTLTVNMGPTGKAKGNEKITAKRTERGVELAIAGKSDRAMHFTYVSPNTPNGFDYDEFLGKP